VEVLNNIANMLEDILVEVKFTLGYNHIIAKKIETIEKLLEKLKNEKSSNGNTTG
jgi:hypothetical protein